MLGNKPKCARPPGEFIAKKNSYMGVNLLFIEGRDIKSREQSKKARATPSGRPYSVTGHICQPPLFPVKYGDESPRANRDGPE